MHKNKVEYKRYILRFIEGLEGGAGGTGARAEPCETDIGTDAGVARLNATIGKPEHLFQGQE
jgi:hypothetical protein